MLIAHYHYVHHTKKDCNYGGFILCDWISVVLPTRTCFVVISKHTGNELA